MVSYLERTLCLLVMLHNLFSRRCVAWLWVSQTHFKHHRQLKTRTIGTERQKNWLTQVLQRPWGLKHLNFSTDPTDSESDEPIIPITVLSGFLGSGKTTLLQHMLSNNEGLKIAVVVNDVASVNIDSKLVRGQSMAASSDDGAYSDADSNGTSPSTPAGIVELQNGCACCSLSGELLTSISELLTLSDMRHDDEKFDHIVIEMSGVAEPRSVRNIFQEAIMYDMPLMQRLRLDTLVTVVDCSSFLDYIKSSRAANAEESPELFYRDNVDQINAEEEDDFWMDHLPILPDAQGGVCDLLIEQTEVADVIVLNKIDLLGGRMSVVKEIISALNPRAKVIATSFGKIHRLDEILSYSKGNGVAIDGVVDDHKDYVKAADANNICSDPECTEASHNHDHSSHSHHNSHSHLDEQPSVCNYPDYEDHSHSHSHHSKETSSICKDPNCNDHSHSHSHESTATHAGIGSFVYRARRPFHPARISSLIRKLPIVRGVPDTEGEGIVLAESTIHAFQQVLRSKGFSWMADSNMKALYWSHAGTSFEMQCLGRWWSTLPRNQWPTEAVDAIIADFDVIDHDELTCSKSVGDRRQEIVFIGHGLSEPTVQREMKEALDKCLLDDNEFNIYCVKRSNENSLASCFENTLPTRMLTY